MKDSRESGASFVELVLALAVLAVLLSLAAPSFVAWRGRQQLRGAAVGLSLTVERLRAAALASGRHHGILFELADEELDWTEHVDGDGDGLRRVDAVTGVDPRIGTTIRLRQQFTDLAPGLPSGIPPLSGGGSSAPAVGFGVGRILSCSPEGTSSSGTVYLQSRYGDAAALRVYGPTGRVSLWWWGDGWQRLQ